MRPKKAFTLRRVALIALVVVGINGLAALLDFTVAWWWFVLAGILVAELEARGAA